MKPLFIVFLFLMYGFLLSQDVQVSNTDIYSVDLPHLALSGSTVHMVYGTNFRYYTFDINGPAAPIDNPITPATNYGPNTTDVAVDPLDSNHVAVVYYDYHYDSGTGTQFYGCYVTESMDGGQSFDTPTIVDTIVYGNTLSNMAYNLPQVKFEPGDESSTMRILWRVDSNGRVTNALYMGGRYGEPIRMDDPEKDALELAIGFTVENMIAVSFGIMENGHAKFYLADANGPILVKDDGQTFINTDHFTKAFKNYDGRIEYIFSDFAHTAKLMESYDWGDNWTDKGIIDTHPYTYVAFTRIKPSAPLYLESYYVKLVKNDQDNLVFYVSEDLINWKDGGEINAQNAQISGMMSYYIDLKLDDVNKFLLTAWIDSRTGNEEIFYAKTALPSLVGIHQQNQTPFVFHLSQNYPNPFNPVTQIQYELKKAGTVSLKIYDPLGRLVKTIVNTFQSPGLYAVRWDGKNTNGAPVPSGIYFYKLQIDRKFVKTRKMMLIQ